MASKRQVNKRDSTRIVIDPPTFTPPQEMRSGYLQRRREELEGLQYSAHLGDWKPVMNVVNHVRGTGAMYGFENIGAAAEQLVKAVQNGSAQSMELVAAYVRTVKESYV